MGCEIPILAFVTADVVCDSVTQEINFRQHRRIFNVNGLIRLSAGQAIKLLFESNLTAACPSMPPAPNDANTKTPIHKATSEIVLEMQ